MIHYIENLKEYFMKQKNKDKIKELQNSIDKLYDIIHQ